VAKSEPHLRILESNVLWDLAKVNLFGSGAIQHGFCPHEAYHPENQSIAAALVEPGKASLGS
jgi:hypothetical protein